MNCPSCQTPHDAVRDGRFCAACGVSVQPAPRPAAAAKADAGPTRCAECGLGIEAGAGRCKHCGARQKGNALP